MKRKSIFKAIIAIAVAMAFVTPVAAFANVGTIGVISNGENTDDMKNIVEISTNSDTSDNTETNSNAEKPVIVIESIIGPYIEKPVIDIVESSTVNDASVIVSATGVIIIYVDDDNTEGPWDGTWEHPYQYIQDGIDNATAGDTIYVLNGVYYESVTVDKQLNLVGQSRENVIIDGGGTENVVYVTVNNVNITKFTIRNCGNQYAGIYLYGSSNNNIENCEVYNSGTSISTTGIYIGFSSNNNNITNCNSYDNIWYGIALHLSSYNNIINCNTYNNSEYGIAFSSSPDNNIINCISHDNPGDGIWLDNSQNSKIINCISYNNSGKGIVPRYTSNINIENCITYNNTNYGFYPDHISDSNIINCTAYNSKYGFYLSYVTVSNVVNCTIRNNLEYGLYFRYAKNNYLSNNAINDNAYNFRVYGWNVEDYYNEIDPSNTINGKPIFYLVDYHDIELNETHNIGFLGLLSCTNITAKNADAYGVLLVDTSNSTISDLTLHNGIGVYISRSSQNSIINCNAYDNSIGMYFIYSPNTDLINCVSHSNAYGLTLVYSPDCYLRGNEFYDNKYNFGVSGTIIPDEFYHDIDVSNLIHGKPMYYLIEQSDFELNETDNFGFLGLVSCTNVTAKNSDIWGVLIVNTTYSTISNVSSHNSSRPGIDIINSPNNNVIDSECHSSAYGICLKNSPNCNIINTKSYKQDAHGTMFANSPNCNLTNLEVYESTYGIYTYGNSYNLNINNCIFRNNRAQGINLGSSPSAKITNCISYDNVREGIYLGSSPNSDVIDCTSYNNQYGIYFASSGDCKIINCDVYNNDYGIYLKSLSGNLAHHNNIINNAQNGYDSGSGGSNIWDDGSEGNYWSDYTGVDEDGDGIGDTPYNISGGNNQDRFPLMMIFDSTPPVITDVQATPAIQTATDPVNITCTVTDNWDMIDTVKVHVDGPDGFTLEEEMNEGSYYYEDTYTTMGIYYYYIWANDTQGNIAVSDTYTFVITEFDKPISAVNPLPTWEIAIPFTVTATAFDNTGVANVTLWYRYSTDGTDWTDWTSYGTDDEEPWNWSFTGSDGYYEFYSIAVDNFGNIEDPPITADASTGIDTTNPVTTHALDPETPDGDNDWYVSNVTVTLSATDDTSGVGSTWYKIDSGYWRLYTAPFTVSSAGEHTVEYYSFDRAGNAEDTKSVDFKIDKIPPVTEHEFDGVIGEDGWFVSNVTITISATDATSGVNYTMYKLDDGEWTTYVDPFVVTEDGEYTLYYYSVDLAGNTEMMKEVDFKIEKDLIPPVTTHEFDGIMGDNDWFTSNVAVMLSAEDDSAGVDHTMYKLDDDIEWQEYTGSFLVTEDGEHTIMYYSVDKVGNEEEPCDPVEFKIDQTPPEINLTAEKIGPIKWLLIADVSDETSGVARVEFYLDGGFIGEVIEAPYEWEWSGMGSHTAQAIVYDNAGNQALSDKKPISKPSSSTSLSQIQISSPASSPLFSWLFGLW